MDRPAPSRSAVPDLALAVDDHFRMQVIAFGHVARRGAVSVSDHGVLAHVGVPSIFNRATALDLDQPDVALSKAQRFFDGLPHTLWLADVDDDVDRLLRGRGYTPMPPVAGMGRHLPADLPQEGRDVKLITDLSLAPGVAAIASAGFGFGAEDRMVLEDLVRNVLRHAKPFHHGAVYGVLDPPVSHPTGSAAPAPSDPRAVASMGLLLCTTRVAGLSTIATSANCRHRGYATAVIARALHDAAALGYTATGTVTNPDTGPLMRSLGFEPLTWYRVYRQVGR